MANGTPGFDRCVNPWGTPAPYSLAPAAAARLGAALACGEGDRAGGAAHAVRRAVGSTACQIILERSAASTAPASLSGTGALGWTALTAAWDPLS